MYQAEHHLTKDDGKTANPEQMVNVAGIVDRTSECTDKKEEKGLQRADPGNGGRGFREELAGLVIGLICTVRVQDTPKAR